MKHAVQRKIIGCFLAAILTIPAFAARVSSTQSSAPPNGKPVDPGWPREFVKTGQKVVVYQPQVDSWDDYTKLQCRRQEHD